MQSLAEIVTLFAEYDAAVAPTAQDLVRACDLCLSVCEEGLSRPLKEYLLAVLKKRFQASVIFCGVRGQISVGEMDCAFIMQLSLRVHSFLFEETILADVFKVFEEYAPQNLRVPLMQDEANKMLLIHYGNRLYKCFHQYFMCIVGGFEFAHYDSNESFEADDVVEDRYDKTSSRWFELFPNYSLEDALKAIRLAGWHILFQEQIKDCITFAIKDKVDRICQDQSGEAQLQRIQQWKDIVVLPIVSSLYEKSSPNPSAMVLEDERPSKEQSQFVSMLDDLVFSSLVHTRARGMFELIADFPDSTPALAELTEVLKHNQQHHVVGR